MLRLFAVYIGGEMQGANIELHDMRFAVGERIEDTYGQLQRQWWGIPETLHIDCWSELTQADGYAITLSPEPCGDGNRLYYVNLGGYDEKEFLELHKNVFVVAESDAKAKVRALKSVRHWRAFHKDDIYEAEQVFCLSDEIQNQRLYIHLEKIEDETPAAFTCQYKKIGKKSAEGE